MNCPICDKPVDNAVRPFCSQRCADVDLSRWLKGSYAIPGASDDDAAAELDATQEPAPTGVKTKV